MAIGVPQLRAQSETVDSRTCYHYRTTGGGKGRSRSIILTYREGRCLQRWGSLMGNWSTLVNTNNQLSTWRQEDDTEAE